MVGVGESMRMRANVLADRGERAAAVKLASDAREMLRVAGETRLVELVDEQLMGFSAKEK